jgi:hypothetical protein
MQTDDAGQIAGEFYLPDATWRSGNKLLRITDNALNNVSATVTSSESTFVTKGILQSREQLLISTREVQNLRELPNDEAIVTDTVARSTEKTNWINPLCQTIHVDPSTFPKGLFLRNVTLYFSAKELRSPLTSVEVFLLIFCITKALSNVFFATFSAAVVAICAASFGDVIPEGPISLPGSGYNNLTSQGCSSLGNYQNTPASCGTLPGQGGPTRNFSGYSNFNQQGFGGYNDQMWFND